MRLTIENITSYTTAVRYVRLKAHQTRILDVTINELEYLAPKLQESADKGLIRYSTCESEAIESSIEGAVIGMGSGPVPGFIEVFNQGTLLGVATQLDFVGTDVEAVHLGGGRMEIRIPPAGYLSHWNTADGSNGSQLVAESISRTLARISAPSGGEGNPFSTAGWAGSNQDATLDTSVSFTTPQPTTGFGGDSTIQVEVFDADGSTLQSEVAPITADGTQSFGNIQIQVTSFGADSQRYQAKVAVLVNIEAILLATSRLGGRYSVRITHTTDSTTDGSGPYIYQQDDVLLDTNATTPSISGTTTLVETPTAVVTKHLSGLEYYTLGSDFTVDVTGIDQLNRNTARIDSNLVLLGPEYGLPTLQHSPFGTGSVHFSNWTPNHDVDGVDYRKTDWEITQSNHRYTGPTANVQAAGQDPWNTGVVSVTGDALVLVDTYGVTSTDTYESFDDEARRAVDDFSGSFDSTVSLVAGQAMVYGGQLIVPNQSTLIRSDGPQSPNANWTAYAPTLSGPNPNYSALGAPVRYNRQFSDSLSRASFQMQFTGSFASGSALADLQAGNLEIFVYRVGGLGNSGPPPANIAPLWVHAPFNFATFDDGATQAAAGSGIREGSSSGNEINCTFGGLACTGGIYCVIWLRHADIQISSLQVNYF